MHVYVRSCLKLHIMLILLDAIPSVGCVGITVDVRLCESMEQCERMRRCTNMQNEFTNVHMCAVVFSVE